MSKHAYPWSQELATERYWKIQQIRRNWLMLYGQHGDRSHYARYQWAGANCSWWSHEPIEAVVHGRRELVFWRVVEPSVWFARSVYLRALEATREAYPRFDEHHYEDGPRVAERILVMSSAQYDCSWSELLRQLIHQCSSQEHWVREKVIFEAIADDAPIRRTFPQMSRQPTVLLTLVKRTEHWPEAQYLAFAASTLAGNEPELDPEPTGMTYQQLRSGLIELSTPELAVLNEHDAFKSLRPVDEALFDAVKALSLERVQC